MQEIQTKAIKTYLENLEYLKDKHKSLYERVTMLSNAIENNEYKERYHLEYIKEDQEFDIYDESTKTYVYNRKPKEFIKEAVKNSNLDKLNSMDLLDPELYNEVNRYDILPKMELIPRTSGQLRNDIMDYIQILKKPTTYKNKKFKYIDKFIFIGTLQGSHIEPIVKSLNLKFFMIYEYNLEIFRLSLFSTNYYIFSKNKDILFSIMDETPQLDRKLNYFFNYAVRSNYMIKYYCSNYNISDFFDRLLIISNEKSPFGFNYMRILESLLKPSLENITKYPVLKTNINLKLLKDIPVLIIAAGPSFTNNIDWIRNNKNNFFIVAVGAVVKRLIKEDIHPSLIISLDSNEIVIKQFPLEIHEEIKNIPFLTSAATFHKVIKIFNKKSIILYEMMCNFKSSSAYLEAYSIGEMTLQLISILGAKNIYMIGTDLALDQKTGFTHEDNHIHNSKFDISENKKKLNSFMNSDSYSSNETIVVKGNLSNKVITTLTLNKSILIYNKIIKDILKKDKYIKIYNLNNGAYIEGTIPKNIHELSNIEIENLPSNNDVIYALNKNSEIGLNISDKKNLKESLLVIKFMISELEKYKNIKIKSYDDFIKSREYILNIIQNQLSKYSSLFLDDIFIKYFLTMERYLGFQFNEKLLNETNLIKKVKQVWIKHMLRLANKYKSIIQNATNT